MPSSTASAEPTGPAHLDLLVVGSGIAGLSAALGAARHHGLAVGLLTKGSLADAATRWAQGGVAAVLGGAGDSTDLHFADTLSVGAGLCDPDAVRVMVDEGPDLVAGLVSLGARFDRDADGQLSLGREGGHSASRVVHAGGAATGAEIERVLVDAVRATAARVVEHAFAIDLLVGGDGCGGVLVRHGDGTLGEVRAANVLVATGGAGQVYSVTTNPAEATGDGVAMALRAQVACADLEFVQFHPTALHVDRSPRPLVTEALRGEGALLRDLDGERFVDELSARDVVSRAMTRRMLDTGATNLWLDVTGVDDRRARRCRSRRLGRLAAGVARRPLPVRRHRDRPRRGHVPRRAVGGRGGGVQRGARRQPPGVELAARGTRVRVAGGGVGGRRSAGGDADGCHGGARGARR